MNYPITLEAYIPTRSGDLLVRSEVVNNEIEADSFKQRYAGRKIVVKNKNKLSNVWGWLIKHPVWGFVSGVGSLATLILLVWQIVTCNRSSELNNIQQDSTQQAPKTIHKKISDTLQKRMP